MFKTKPIEITFKTFDPYLLKNLSPISHSKKFPEWFKNTPPFSGEGSVSENFRPIKAPTIRRCPAINDYFNTGITIPGWTDVEFFVDGQNNAIEWRYSNIYPNTQLIQPHNNDQFPHLADKYIHAKIISPWIAECNTDVKWFLTKPSYFSEFDDQDVVFCDGVINFYNNFVTNVNLFFPKRSNTYTVKFTGGLPFQKYIPLTEKPINITAEYCTMEYFEMASLKGRKVSYSLGKLYNILKKNNRKEK